MKTNEAVRVINGSYQFTILEMYELVTRMSIIFCLFECMRYTDQHQLTKKMTVNMLFKFY